MVRIVEILCKTLRKSLLKKCAQKSGKETKWTFKQDFLTRFHNVLNRKFSPYNKLTFHSFHIVYNYYYLNN